MGDRRDKLIHQKRGYEEEPTRQNKTRFPVLVSFTTNPVLPQFVSPLRTRTRLLDVARSDVPLDPRCSRYSRIHGLAVERYVRGGERRHAPHEPPRLYLAARDRGRGRGR